MYDGCNLYDTQFELLFTIYLKGLEIYDGYFDNFLSTCFIEEKQEKCVTSE